MFVSELPFLLQSHFRENAGKLQAFWHENDGTTGDGCRGFTGMMLLCCCDREPSPKAYCMTGMPKNWKDC
jgi:hypothetical protein